MKLKKIASLMLAGVMAVSMLAGCSGKGTDNKGEETVTASTLTGKVISALDEDTTKKVAFSSSSVLDAAIAKAVQQVGVDDTISNDLLNQINSDISEKDELAAIGTASYKNNKNKARAYLKTQKCLKDKKKTQKDSIIGSKGSDRMTIHRYEVTDAEWDIIEPMLPKHHMGRPQKDLRAHFNGILWIARSGARWEDLPARYGPHQTVYSCFCRWRDDGTLERIFHKLGANAELEELNIDSTTSKVSEQASRGPRKR